MMEKRIYDGEDNWAGNIWWGSTSSTPRVGGAAAERELVLLLVSLLLLLLLMMMLINMMGEYFLDPESGRGGSWEGGSVGGVVAVEDDVD